MSVSEQAGRANRPDIKEIVSHADDLKELLELRMVSQREIMDERDQRYMERFRAMDEKTSLALSASEKAVGKAEMATEKRFDSVNEFRAQLKDQASTLMPREESTVKFAGVESKIDELKKEIVLLREFRSGSGSKDMQKEQSTHNFFAIFAALGSLGALILALAAFLSRK
jgi:hypothetical protein